MTVEEAPNLYAHPTAYASLGLRVFPIPHASKAPVLPQWQNRATNDVNAIESLWLEGLNTEKRPNLWRPPAPYNMGIAPDQLPDGRWLWVIDVDGASHNADGLAWWARLEAEHGPAPATVTAATGGGGVHYLFLRATEPRNGTLDGVPKEDIQTRGHGGFIVVAPSIHDETRQPYRWLDGHAPWDLPIADAPPWLLELDIGGGRQREAVEAPRQAPLPQPESDRPGDLWAAATSWDQLMSDEGWQLHHVDRDTTAYWTRPGKSTRGGASATTNYGGGDTLKVFTSSVPGLDADATYTKIGFYAALHHRGDVSEAASALRARGFHAPRAESSFAGLTTGPPRLATPPQAHQTPQEAAHGAAGGVHPTCGPGQVLDWPEPLPMPTMPAPPPWPTHVLPAWAQGHVENVARQVHCAPDLPGMFILGALSAASLGHVEVEARKGHVEPTTMYLVVAAPPSEGKSAAMKMVMEPLVELEEKWIEWAKADVAKAEAKRSIADKRAKELADNAARTDEADRIDAAIKAREHAESIVVPPSGRLLVGDVTPERLAVLLSENGERLAIVSDESGVLEFNRYGQGNKSSNLDLHLNAWNGGKVTVDRVTAPSVRLKKPLLTIVVGAQPPAWAAALSNQEFRDRGLGARFMSATPQPQGHQRNVDLDRDEWDDEAADTYHRTFIGLAAKWRQTQQVTRIRLSSEAKKTYTAWAQSLQAQMGPGGLLSDESSWVNKMRDTVIRAAGVLHMADGGQWNEAVSAPVMARCCDLGDYWIGHRLHHRGDEYEDARDLLAALARLTIEDRHAGGDGGLKERIINRQGPNRMRAVAVHAPLLATLAELGWVRIETAFPAADPVALVKSMVAVHVHPEAVEAYANADDESRDNSRQSRQSSTQSERVETGTHAPSTFVADGAVSRIEAISETLIHRTDGSTGISASSQAEPRGIATNVDGEWESSETTTESEEVVESAKDVEPWSLLS